MSYLILNTFIEKHHNNTLYIKGETYPKDGYKADAERVSFLQKKHPEYGVAFLETPKKDEETPKKDKKEQGVTDKKPKSKAKSVKSGDK